MIEEVKKEEHFSRWIFKPRFIDENGVVNDRFVALRPHINEQGLSGQLIDRIGFDVAVSEGSAFVRTKKDGTPLETLYGLAIAQVVDIRGLSLSNDNVDVESVPSQNVSAHAEIRIYINGELATGKSTDFKLRFYLNQIQNILLNGIVAI